MSFKVPVSKGNFSLAEWNEMSEKCFSHMPLGPQDIGHVTYRVGSINVFVAAPIANFPAHPSKDFKFLYNTSTMR